MHRPHASLALGAALVAVNLLACSDDESGGGTSGAGASGGAGSGGSGAASAGGTGATGTGGGGNSCTAEGPTVVSVPTDDGLTLEADFYATGVTGGPGAVLLHMTPAGNHDRTNYPPGFITELTTRGLTVLNVDRRGAGNSEGSPTDAFEGPNGKLDAKGAYDFLTSHPCDVDATRIVYVGASNGTTTALDFAVYADGEPSVERPAGLVFLTGGGYTENQETIDGNRALLEARPIQFVYSTAESAWSAQFEVGAPPNWVFAEYANGDHGTLMFDAEPGSIADVADFVAAAVAP